MMKFFRKYNKHMLAVFMALLLVIWLGGTALDQMVRPDTGGQVLGKSDFGTITQADRERAEYFTSIQERLGLSWRQDLGRPDISPDEQVDTIDWLLLYREAVANGQQISPAIAKAYLNARGMTDDQLADFARRLDVKQDTVLAACAEYFTVRQMIDLCSGALAVPETQLRVLARDAFERASTEVVKFPARAFIDEDAAFTDAGIEAQFAAHRADAPGEGLMFGYYLEPSVDIQYIEIDPQALAEHLRLSDSSLERKAFALWKANPRQFRRTPEQIAAARVKAEAASATSNGAPPKPPEVSPWCETFDEAQATALSRVRDEEAQAEADRLANKVFQVLADPWFDVQPGDNGYKPAPGIAARDEHYPDVLAGLPANLHYPAGIEVKSYPGITKKELAKTDDLGIVSIQLGPNRFLPLAEMAFNVEGHAELPEDAPGERTGYLALWETPRQVKSTTGKTYLFRIIRTIKGAEPTSADEVRDRVVADLRLQQGMAQARAAAEKFVADLGTQGLREAWDQATDLAERFSETDGGFANLPPFARDSGVFGGAKNTVPILGTVPPAFIKTAFELAANPEADTVKVLDLPDSATVVALRGLSLSPVYQEDYDVWRPRLVSRLLQQNFRTVLGDWLNAENIRQRNGFTFGEES